MSNIDSLRDIVLSPGKRWLLLSFLLIALPCFSQADQAALTKARVARLAAAAAKHAGYDLHRFKRPTFSFVGSGAGSFWLVRYEGMPDENGMTTVGNFFSVRLYDRDRRTTVVPGY